MTLREVENFAGKMRAAGNRLELVVYGGRGHVFEGDPDDYVDTMRRADAFLASLGYLEGEPNPQAILALQSRFPTDRERWGL